MRKKSEIIDLQGQRFGRFVVKSTLAEKLNTNTPWLCLCECGKEKLVNAKSLLKGATQSCGCYHRQRASEANIKHGCARVKKATPEYKTWSLIIARCCHPGDSAYRFYGAKGITICDRWRHSFTNFLEDMGTKPSPEHSIDRINVYGGYSPENCRWATRLEQMRNTRRTKWIEFQGQKKSLAEWCEILNLNYQLTYKRLVQKGWSIEQAFLALAE